eukprot:scaffold10856_cov63-Phaeocystis_antarctica.AAC.4
MLMLFVVVAHSHRMRIEYRCIVTHPWRCAWEVDDVSRGLARTPKTRHGLPYAHTREEDDETLSKLTNETTTQPLCKNILPFSIENVTVSLARTRWDIAPAPRPASRACPSTLEWAVRVVTRLLLLG